MNAEHLTGVVAKFVADMPREIRGQLTEVDVLVYQTVAEANAGLKADGDFEDPIPAVVEDCKGVFIGEPMEADGDGEEEATEVVDACGVIALVADHIPGPDEGVVVLCHEIGHALGLDEEGVAALGLGMPQKPAEVAKPEAKDAPATP